MISSTSGTVNIRKKRDLTSALFGAYVESDQQLDELFHLVDQVDFEGPLNETQAQMVYQMTSLRALNELEIGTLMLIPGEPPGTGEIVDLLFLATSSLGFAILQGYAGNSLYVQLMGCEQEISEFEKFQANLRVKVNGPQKWAWVIRPSASATPTEFEKRARAALQGASTGKLPASVALPQTSGAIAVDNSVQGGKKLCGVWVQDLNGDQVQVFSKDKAYERMAMVGGLRREMSRERFAILVEDLMWEREAVWCQCVQHQEKELNDTDPMQSIKRMPMVGMLPVCKDRAKWESWMLGKLEHGNWTNNLIDFKRPGDAVWGESIDFEGRMSLMRAMEAFGDFQRTFKGEGFKGCMEPLRSIWEATNLSPDVSLSRYHNAFLHYKLEGLVRDYFHEVRATRGRFARRTPGASLVGQGECAAFLRLLMEEFVDAIMMKRWEQVPHEEFYSPGSAYSSVRNNPLRPRRVEKSIEGRVLARSLTGGGGYRESSRSKPGATGWQTKSKPYHAHGLCLWHLASQLGLKNKVGEPFRCQETQQRHSRIQDVLLSTVKELVHNPAFMDVAIHDDLKTKVRQAVESQSSMFKKG